MSAADLRESVAWAPELLVAMAKAHDQEASAQKGEPSPWDVSIFGEPDQSFVAERVVAMQCALRAIADARPSEKMVEAAARVILENDHYALKAVEGAGYLAKHVADHPDDEISAFNLRSVQRAANKEWGGCMDVARSALSAALKEMG